MDGEGRDSKGGVLQSWDGEAGLGEVCGCWDCGIRHIVLSGERLAWVLSAGWVGVAFVNSVGVADVCRRQANCNRLDGWPVCFWAMSFGG